MSLKPKKNDQWPRVREIDYQGATAWQVDSRKLVNGVKFGEREVFESEAQAAGRAAVIRSKAAVDGLKRATECTPNLELYELAETILAPYHVNVVEAAKFYVEHLKDNPSKVNLSTAVEDFLVFKQQMVDAGKFTDISYNGVKYRTKLLLEGLGDTPLTQITADDFKTWAKTCKYTPTTLRGVKSVGSELFLWCKGKGWMRDNPCEALKLQSSDDGEVEILTPDAAKALMAVAAQSPERKRTLPYVLLGMFAGLRPVEAEHLEFGAIDFKTLEIRVVGYGVRYVPIEAKLAAKLKSMKWEGELGGKNWRKIYDAVKLFAGYNQENPYPADCLRHSYASYWLAIHSDRARLAEIMGNSVGVIARHYLKAIPKNEAQQFWGLL